MYTHINNEDMSYFNGQINELKELGEALLEHSATVRYRDDFCAEKHDAMVSIYKDCSRRLCNYFDDKNKNEIIERLDRFCFGVLHEAVDLRSDNFLKNNPWEH